MPATVSNLTGATGAPQVAVGQDRACAIRSDPIRSDGTIWCWGRNDYGELGDGTTNERQTADKILPNVQGG